MTLEDVTLVAQALHLKPGDALVVKCEGRDDLNIQHQLAVLAELSERFPEVQVIYLPTFLTLDHIPAEQLKKLLATNSL